MYSMGLTKFQELAKEAKACYKIGQLVLVNTEILDEYLERYDNSQLMVCIKNLAHALKYYQDKDPNFDDKE